MNRVFFKGLKGGTGTTTVVANIATLMAQSNHEVLCIDLDNKNELALHFGHDWHKMSGWANGSIEDSSFWRDSVFVNEDSVRYLPFGTGCPTFEKTVAVINQLNLLELEPSYWLFFDVPTHFPLDDIISHKNDIFVNVITCDPVCFSQIKKENSSSKYHYLINKFNASNTLELDIYQIWREKLKQITPFFVHFDSAVPEALAAKNVLVNTSPHSVLKEDFHALASWLNNKRKSLS
ncbi:cellulose biosynthesis protein BcsQ [Pseudoalteromonas spongiae]|uniref:cellulose biosynthesis protein BcsQ n=1 Tax=Pseudoalteromonas spongiae TaxID=298657 RepID=UPI000C2D47B1|nr:cellulose biosynthesis protein BcsQ [Pseudoalteromonas spongiae]TMO83256.1 cellulose synthase operon protein YhjQ [Pseudoalteromonas spongiae]